MRTHAALASFLMLAGCAGSEDGNSGAMNASANAEEPRFEVPEEPPPAAPPVSNDTAPKAEAAGACNTQDGATVKLTKLRAVGTEPFWGARTEGRCVLYSTPEDQAGTRVWAKAETGSKGTVWTGALHGKPFVLTVKPEPGCSDGMSDKSYPMSATLKVNGETRNGCAEALN